MDWAHALLLQQLRTWLGQASVIVLFELMAHRQHDDFGWTDDFERADRKPVLRGRPYRLDRGLGAIEVFNRLGLVEKEVEQVFQVVVGRRSQPDDEAQWPSALRFASSLDCNLPSTLSTGNDKPVRWYSSPLEAATPGPPRSWCR